MQNKKKKRKGEGKNKELGFLCVFFCFVFTSADKCTEKLSFAVENMKITIDKTTKN